MSELYHVISAEEDGINVAAPVNNFDFLATFLHFKNGELCLLDFDQRPGYVGIYSFKQHIDCELRLDEHVEKWIDKYFRKGWE